MSQLDDIARKSHREDIGVIVVPNLDLGPAIKVKTEVHENMLKLLHADSPNSSMLAAREEEFAYDTDSDKKATIEPELIE